MEQDFEWQFKVFLVILAIIFLILLGRLWQLQVLEGRTYSELSSQNAARIIPILAPRGIIYDRYGKVMVRNRALFSVYLIPSSLKNKDKTIRTLSRIVKIPEEGILKKLEIARPFEPVLVKDNLSLETVTRLEEEKHKMPGMVVSVRPVRAYPYKSLAAHLLGYIGEIESEELAKLRNAGYRLGDLIGKSGLESTYDLYLRGIDGGQQIEVDVYGRPIKIAGASDPVPGKDVKLTIDLELQQVVEKNLAGKSGAVVVIDPRNGEILAMASSPSFDPNIFAAPLSRLEWQRLDKQGHPFHNRALSAFPPGSTFKVVTLSSTLQEKTADLKEIIDCKGYFKLGNRIAKCWREKGHGKLNIIEGLVWSCDIVFYELGLENGPERLSKYAKAYGLGEKTGVDLPGEISGFVPTADWKKKALGEGWVKGDSINYGIGQGFILVTPLQMANLYGTIATGKRFMPHVVKEVTNRNGKKNFEYEPEEIGDLPISKENQTLLQKTLAEVVKRGTGIAARVTGIPAAGKTGTAENPKEPHAWFMCYAPADNPEIVIISFVEHGVHGDRVTAYIAREILTWYRDHRLKKAEEKISWTK